MPRQIQIKTPANQEKIALPDFSDRAFFGLETQRPSTNIPAWLWTEFRGAIFAFHGKHNQLPLPLGAVLLCLHFIPFGNNLIFVDAPGKVDYRGITT
jgi:hypothetical protein